MKVRIAILDDYQNVALEMADWSPLADKATLTVFNDHLSQADEIVNRLVPFDVVCVIRERTPLNREILARLPRLKLIASAGRRNASIDLAAAADHNIDVMHTGYDSSSTVELTWALILASARNLVIETASVRSGGWQRTVGDACIHHGNGDITLRALQQQVRPELGLDEDDHLRRDRPQITAHNEGEVQRKIEEAVGAWDAFARNGLTGFRDGGNK